MTHLVARGFDGGVVLDLPQTFAETFPFVGFPELLLAFFIGEEVFGPQECPAWGRGGSSEGWQLGGVGWGWFSPHPETPRGCQQHCPTEGSIHQCPPWPHLPHVPGPHSRFMGPKEEDLVFIGGRFYCSFWHLINLCDTKDGVRIWEGKALAPLHTGTLTTSWDMGVLHAASN